MVGTFKKRSRWFWVQPSLEGLSAQAPDPPLHQGGLWTLHANLRPQVVPLKKKKKFSLFLTLFTVNISGGAFYLGGWSVGTKL